MSNFTKILPLEAEMFHVDGHRETDGQALRQTYIQAKRHSDRQTDTTKLIVAFRNFANAPN